MWQPSPHEVSDVNISDCSAVDWLKIYSTVLCLNSWQVNRYFQQYSKSSLNGFSHNDLSILQHLYDDAQSFSREGSASASNMNVVMTLLSDGLGRYTKYLHAAAALARSKWTKFSDGFMAFGVIMLLISLLVQLKAVYVLIVLGSSSLLGKFEDCIMLLPLQEMSMSGFIFGITSASALTIISVLVYLFSGRYVPLSKTHFVIIVIGSTVLGTAKSYLFRRNGQLICNMNNREPKRCWQQWVACHDLIGLLSIFFSCIHAISLLSNSFILREQHVVTFFLVSIGFLDLRMALQQNSRVPQALCFLILNFVMSSFSEVNLLKESGYQTGETTPEMAISSQPSIIWQLFFILCTVYIPLVAIGGVFMKILWKCCFIQKFSTIVLHGLGLTYAAICLHWLLDDLHKLHLMAIPEPVQEFARLKIPQILYFAVAFQMVVILCNIQHTRKCSEMQLKNSFEEGSLALLGVLSGVILLLLGRQGPFVAVIAGLEAWCLLEKQSLYAPLQRFQCDTRVDINYSSATIQWSLFAVQVFFCTGHRCSFDGLRYAAAFIGYDHFNIYRQGALLALDTFGASHILPIIGVALLVSKRSPPIKPIFLNKFYKLQISQAMLMFELLRTLTTTFTTVCVTIQRRHLMVWGLFAPKFVFDAIGLLVTDVLVLFGFTYVMWPSLF